MRKSKSTVNLYDNGVADDFLSKKRNQQRIKKEKIEIEPISTESIDNQVQEFNNLFLKHRPSTYEKIIESIISLRQRETLDPDELRSFIDNTTLTVEEFVVNFNYQELKILVENFTFDRLYDKTFSITDIQKKQEPYDERENQDT